MADNVNHPAHYEQTCSLECIQVMKLLLGNEGVAYFCMGNAFKYMWRYKNKNKEEDLDKAEWYLEYVANKGIDRELSPNNLALFKNLFGLLSEIQVSLIAERNIAKKAQKKEAQN